MGRPAAPWSTLADEPHVVVRLVRDSTSRCVRLAIARPCAQLLPRDQVWRDLHPALRDSPCELRPLRAVPAS